jgi:hypothetical protein
MLSLGAQFLHNPFPTAVQFYKSSLQSVVPFGGSFLLLPYWYSGFTLEGKNYLESFAVQK